MDPATAAKIFKPVVNALMPRVARKISEKILGTALEQELANVVDNAWAATAATLATDDDVEVRDLDELGILLGRALACAGVAEALVVSVFDPSRLFELERYPEAGEILAGADPASIPVRVKRLERVFVEALRKEVVAGAGQSGLFQLTVVAQLENLAVASRRVEESIRAMQSRLGGGLPDPGPSPYLATVADLLRRTPELRDREAELAELVSFATGPHGYWWMVGGHWAGKTALVAHLTKRLEPNIDWVAYFLVRRLGDADSTRFLTVINDQLARMLHVEIPAAPDDIHRFRSLWQEAAARAEAQGRHLLLVVDALDEDLSGDRGRPSVASCLPTLVGHHAHVIVTSRSHPDLPRDVDVEHPLRSVHRVLLTPSPYAEMLKERAKQELRAVLAPSGLADPNVRLARELLCLLAAAEGPLAVGDLASLSDQDLEVVEGHVYDRIARLLQLVGAGDRFIFGHDTLREASVEEFTKRGRLHAARERLMGWADAWARRGWPLEDTPLYLLDTYPEMLAHASPDRLLTLCNDLAYLEAAVARVGVDRTCAILRLRPTEPGGGRATPLPTRLLIRQAHHLRLQKATRRPGYTTQQLCLQALAAGAAKLADRATDRINQLSPPQLLPCWTTWQESGALERILTSPTDFVGSVAISADGTRAVGAGERAVHVWDLELGLPIGEPLAGHSDMVDCVAISGDGTRAVSGGEDSTVRVWDLGHLTPFGDPLVGHTDWVGSVAISADGTRAVSGGRDGMVHVWDLQLGVPMGEPLTGHTDLVECVAISADATRAVSGGRDGTMRVWDLEHLTPFGDPLVGHTDWVECAISADGTVAVSGGADGAVRLWDLEHGISLGKPLIGHAGDVRCVAITADGTRAVSGGQDRTVRVWDLKRGISLGKPLIGHTGEVSHVAVSADGTRALSTDEYGTMRVWDFNDVTLLGEPRVAQTGSVGAVAVTPEGTRAVSGGADGALRVWDLKHGIPLGEPLTGHSDVVDCVAISADGTRAVSGGVWDGTVRVWDLEHGIALGKPLIGHGFWVRSVAITADGTRAVSGGQDRTVRVWDLKHGIALGKPLTGHRDWVGSVAISADGTRAVSGSADATMRVWDLEHGLDLGEALTGHSGTVRSVAITPDGTRAVSGGDDGTVRVWDLEHGIALGKPLSGHMSEVTCVTVSADGIWVMSGGNDGTVRVWDVRISRCLVLGGLPALLTDLVWSDLRYGNAVLLTADLTESLTMWRLRLPSAD